MNLILKSFLSISLVSLLFISCAKDESVNAHDWAKLDELYVHLTFDSLNYFLESNDYQIKQGIEKSGCVNDLTYGMYHTDLITKEEGNDFISGLSLGITRKVAVTDLGAPKEIVPGGYFSYTADDLAYMRNVFTNEGLGSSPIGFPINSEGYSLNNKDENGLVPTEVYLFINTQDDKLYRSTSDENVPREDDSYFRIINVLNLGDTAPEKYVYIVEGEFRVNVFYENSYTDSKVVEGSFRLPIYTFGTVEALNQCK